MINQGHLIFGYQFCYRHKYGNRNYVFKPTLSSSNIIDNFLLALEKEYGEINSLGANYVVDYLLFQFNRVEGQSFKRFASIKDNQIQQAGRVQAIDIFSKKSFEYWLQRNKKFDYQLKSNTFVKRYGVDVYLFKELITMYGLQTEHTTLPIYEERIKQKKFNSPEGLSQCVSFTTMHNPESYFCKVCVYKTECRFLQSQYLPSIYADRFRPVKLEHGYNN